MTPEQRLIERGLVLPQVPKPIASYVPYRSSGNLLFLSGQVPRAPDGQLRIGRVGREVPIADAYADARNVGLQLLAVAKAALGDLERISAVIKLFGMVNADPDFGDHPKVINGCSDLLVEILGDCGRHARSAVGMGSLPSGVTVEIEVILEFRQQ
jgi:enamine deaminase RidA (YjgF/YER057c/UK114 family)